MPLSIGSLFSRGLAPKPEISAPIVDRAAPKNCTLISSSCNVDGVTVINRRSCSYDMRPPGAGERQPLLKMSASEVQWLSQIITNDMKSSN
ncbi:secretion protein EspO [Escherichia coli]|nr:MULTISPECIES: secretion protein EspO [Escherichia]EEW2719457.1 secretion protein EspO [Escherichia coli]EFE7330976.1 secretion protein EspO [Escherichia coli]EFN9946620.1 secretion protein EspO [Escherichia coli]EGD5183704.1 secretion protein EspO [Escherichia coli]MCZ7518707.1 secretion protein EspO [Escherichia albertii]